MSEKIRSLSRWPVLSKLTVAILNIYLYTIITSYTNTMLYVSYINQTEIKIGHCLQVSLAYRVLAPLPLESLWVNFQPFLFINRREQTQACTSRFPPFLHRNTTRDPTPRFSHTEIRRPTPHPPCLAPEMWVGAPSTERATTDAWPNPAPPPQAEGPQASSLSSPCLGLGQNKNNIHLADSGNNFLG